MTMDIYTLRQWFGMSRTKLARRLNVTERTVKRWENAKSDWTDKGWVERKPKPNRKAQRMLDEMQRVKDFMEENRITTLPIMGYDWLELHRGDHTQAELDSLTIEVTSGKRITTLKAGVSKKDLREVLSDITK